MMKYLAEYLRLSMEDGDAVIGTGKIESDSISHQRDLIAEYKSNHVSMGNYQSLEFVDDGYSGTNFERPAVQKLFAMVKEGKIGCIVVKDISRFGRNYLEVGDYLEQILPFMGVRFISINDHYDSNDYVGTTGGVEVAFRSLMYDIYSKDLSVKMRSALEVRRKRGDYIGPQPPFGYAFSKNKRILAVDPIAAEYVKHVFSLAGLGYRTGEIAMLLNKEKIPTPGQYKNIGKSKETYHMSDGTGFWDTKKVLKIIENKVYLGMTVNSKYAVTKIGGSQFVRVPDEERIYVPNTHEAIVSEEEFQDAMRVVQNRGIQRNKKHQRKETSILLGKLYCGECRRSLHRIKDTTIPYFKCPKKDFIQDCACPQLRLQEPEIEATVWKCILQELAKAGGIQSEIKENSGIMDLEMRINRLEIDGKKFKNDKQHLYEKYKSGIISKEKYRNRAEELRERGRKNSELLEELNRQCSVITEKAELARAGTMFTEMTRAVVDALIDMIYVYEGNRIEIVWGHSFTKEDT